jgi:hypothetical protein
MCLHACRTLLFYQPRRRHQSAIAVRQVPQNTCVITSFLRVTLRDVLTMFTFAIVSSNAWARQRKTSQRHDSAIRKSLAKHARQKFLTNPDASGKIGNNREGELVIGNYQELLGIIGTQFLPIFPNNSQSGKLGVIGSVESQFLESQLFCKFSAKCQIPNFLWSVPGGSQKCCIFMLNIKIRKTSALILSDR